MKLLTNLWSRLSTSTFKLASRIYSFASFIGCVPFEINDPADLTVRETSKWKLICWHGANWIYLFQLAFQICSFLYQVEQHPFDNKLAVHLNYVMTYIFGFVYMMTMYLSPSECILMLNQQVGFMKSLPGLRLPEYKWEREPFVMISLHYFTGICVSGWFLLAIFFVVEPQRSCYIYAYFPLSWQQSWVVYLLFMIYEMTMMLYTVVIWATFYTFWAQDLFMLTHITKNLM